MSNMIIEHQEQQLEEQINNQTFVLNTSHQNNSNSTPRDKTAQEYPEKCDQILENIEDFLFTPIQQGKTLECEVKVEKGWFGRHRKYCFYHSKTQQHIMTAIKSECLGNKKYIFSKSDKNIEQIAQLESNFFGTEFILYSNGSSYTSTSNQNLLRQELAIIQYEFHFLKNSKGNLFRCILPPIVNGKPEIIKPVDKFTGLRIRSRLIKNRNIDFLEFQTQPAMWNDEFQAFILPFNNRVNSPSTHNFLLKQLDAENKLGDQVNIQFGQLNQNTLNIDINFPFTPIQAFATIVSQLDNKIAI